MKKKMLLSTLLLSSFSALAGSAGTLSSDVVKEVGLSELTRKQLTVPISQHYQVQLSLPDSVDAVIGNKPNLVRVTVMPAPLDNVVFLDALAGSGAADLTVFVDGQSLKFKLVIDKAQDGIREYLVSEKVSSPAPQNLARNLTPHLTSPLARIGLPSLVEHPNLSSLGSRVATPHSNASKEGLDQPIEVELQTKRIGENLQVSYVLKNVTDAPIVAHHQDLKVLAGKGDLNVTHLELPGLSVLSPNRVFRGSFEVKATEENLRLVWPMSSLSSRAIFTLEKNLSDTKVPQ